MMIGCRRGLLNQIEPDSPGIRRSAKQWFDKLEEAGKEDLEKKTDGQKKRLTGIQEPAAKATQGKEDARADFAKFAEAAAGESISHKI